MPNSYNALTKEGTFEAISLGPRFIGFDTGHPAVLIDFVIPDDGLSPVSGLFSQYIPLDKPREAAFMLNAIALAVGKPAGWSLQEDRPLCRWMHELGLPGRLSGFATVRTKRLPKGHLAFQWASTFRPRW